MFKFNSNVELKHSFLLYYFWYLSHCAYFGWRKIGSIKDLQ
jgi:hypothetical protein